MLWLPPPVAWSRSSVEDVAKPFPHKDGHRRFRNRALEPRLTFGNRWKPYSLRAPAVNAWRKNER
jgi:hypothetical protein